VSLEFCELPSFPTIPPRIAIKCATVAALWDAVNDLYCDILVYLRDRDVFAQFLKAGFVPKQAVLSSHVKCLKRAAQSVARLDVKC
jgi:hypothetical protein